MRQLNGLLFSFSPACSSVAERPVVARAGQGSIPSALTISIRLNKAGSPLQISAGCAVNARRQSMDAASA